MSDLITFLSARLDEDEALARAATEGPWAWETTGEKDSSWAVGHVQDEDGSDLTGVLQRGQGIVIDGVCEGIDGNLGDAAHIARHSPVRALREVAAKRLILAAYRRVAEDFAHIGENAYEHARRYALEEACEALVAVYSDHPDHDPQWPAMG